MVPLTMMRRQPWAEPRWEEPGLCRARLSPCVPPLRPGWFQLPARRDRLGDEYGARRSPGDALRRGSQG